MAALAKHGIDLNLADKVSYVVFSFDARKLLNLKFLCDRTLPFDKKLPLRMDNGYHRYSTASRSLKAIAWPNERGHSRLSFGHALAFSNLNTVE